MSNPATYGGYGYYGGALTRDQTRGLFSQTMGYVALTAALFAAGAYLGRGLSYGLGFLWFIAAFICLIAMNFTVRKSQQLTVVLLCAFGLLIGLAMSPVLLYYAGTNPSALWAAGGATALFIAGFGAAGYATRRDLSAIARVCFFALLALIIFGIVLIFVQIHDVRLPAVEDLEGHQVSAPARGVDLPGHPERVPVLPADLLAQQLTDCGSRLGHFAAASRCMLNLMSSPGSGKTTLLEHTARALGGTGAGRHGRWAARSVSP